MRPLVNYPIALYLRKVHAQAQATLARITALKVDFAQGYYIAEPEALVTGEGAEPALLTA